MTTKNIIPQADGEGSIGINGTSWASGVFNTGVFEEVFVRGDNVVLSSDFGNVLNNYISKSEIFIGTNANVGIGTTDPEEPLDVRGTIKTKNSNDDSEVKLVSAGGMPHINLQRGSSALGNWKITAKGNGSQQVLATSLGTSDLITVQADGKVGINTANPSEKFEVKSSVISLFRDVNEAGLRNGLQFKLGDSDSTDIPQIYGAVGAVIEKNIAGSHDGALAFTTTKNGVHTVEQEAMRIDSDGNVGINATSPAAKLDVQGDISISGAIVSSDSDGRVVFSDQGLMVGQAEVKPDPDNPTSIYFESIPQVQDSEGNAVTILTADKLGLGTSAVLDQSEQDLQFKLLTDQKRFVVGTSGNAENTIASGWYRFNDFQVKGATDIGFHSINPVDTRIYSDETSFILFKTDTAGNRVAHLVGGNEEVSPNNAIALGIAVKVDNSESPKDIEFVHTDGESYSVINGNSDSLGTNGLPIRQGFQNSSLGSAPSPLLIDGGSF